MKTKRNLKTTYAASLILFVFASLGVIHCAKDDSPDPKPSNGDIEALDQDAVMMAKNALDIGYGIGDSAERVTGNLTLPSTGMNDVVITWESSNNDVINVRTPGVGIVTPSVDANTEVTLTAALTKNAASETKTFMLNVAQRISDSIVVMMAKESLAIGYADGDSASNVTRNITLPLAGMSGVIIAWASDNPMVINVSRAPGTGRVSLPGNNTDITLTATLTKNDAMDTTTFTLTVVAAMYPYVCTNGTAVSGMTNTENTQKCMSCATGYALQPDETCVRMRVIAYPYACTNGTAVSGTTNTEGVQKCMSCATGYALQPDETCQNFPFTCPSGSPTAGTTTTQNVISCHSCDTNYELYIYDRNSNTACRRVYPYVCTNGTAASGTTHIQNTQKCGTCMSGYMLASERCVSVTSTTYPYVCTNGTIASGRAAAQNTQRCSECDMGYHLQEDETCKNFDYVCDNGTPTEGKANRANVTSCASCDAGFFITSNTRRCESIGTVWSAPTSGTTDNLQAVAHGGGTFVAVGNLGVIVTSTDTTTWTLQQKTSGSEMVNYVTSNLFGVAYGGSKFVAVGDLGVILTSTDGTTWTLQQKTDSATMTMVNYVTSSLNGVTYGGGKFVAVGARGNILTSTDGTTWTLQQKTSGSEMVNYTIAQLNDVVYASNKFVAVGASGTVLTSSDGASWTIQTTPSTNEFSDVAYGGGTFAAVGFSGEIATSSDAITWTRNQKSQLDDMSMTVMVNYTASRIGALAYGAGSFLLGDFSGKIFQSSTDEDGVVTWITNSTISPASLAGTFFLDMTYASGKFVAVASGGLIFTRQ